MKLNQFFKISLLGDNRVGKTQIRKRFMGRGFRKEHLMTIGADFAIKGQTLTTGEYATFQIWDLAPGNTFRSVRSRFYSGSMGALIIFDQNIPSSFMGLTKWIVELWTNSGRGVIPFVLLGNKQDLGYDDLITRDMVEQYANAISNKTEIRYGFRVKYFETSVITGLNINEAFDFLGRLIIKARKKGKMNRV